MKLSIIIPVYNVEKYIEKCIQSCLDQDILPNDYEIIVVIDGSPDNSLQIVNRLVKLHTNIHTLNQENQGLSAARNNGFAIAKGEYVWFIDSDDWIEKNCLKRITSKLTNNLDILQIQHRLVYDDNSKNRDCYTTIKGIITGKEQIIKGGLPAPAQFTIFRSEFLRANDLKFVKGIYHEDSEFKPRATYLAESISSDDIISYNYYQRSNGSITSVFSLKRALDIIFVNNSLYDFCSNLPEVHKKYFNDFIGVNINTILYGFHALPPSERNMLKQHINKNKHLFVSMMKSSKLKYQIEGFILHLNVNIGISFHKFLK